MEIKLLSVSRAWPRGSLWELPWGRILRTARGGGASEKPGFLGLASETVPV